MADRSLLVVNYRSARLTADAIASARETSLKPLEVVVVDNSCDPGEAAQLRSLPIDELVIASSNTGYSGGINMGVKHCSGDLVILSNPDILFRPGAIDRLCASVEGGAAMAGPKFVWDEAGNWILPPASAPTLAGKIREIASVYSSTVVRRRDRALITQRVRFWSLDQPSAVSFLSGAVMCIRTADVLRFGGFDESFQLYFEEIDFMNRIRRSGRRLEYVPAAICRHLYNQSAGISAESAQKYQASELRYLEKWSGATAVRVLAHTGKQRAERSAIAEMDPTEAIELREPLDNLVVEASPLATFESAAGLFPRETRIFIPEEILATFRQAELYVRVVRRDNCETLHSWVIRKVFK